MLLPAAVFQGGVTVMMKRLGMARHGERNHGAAGQESAALRVDNRTADRQPHGSSRGPP